MIYTCLVRPARRTERLIVCILLVLLQQPPCTFWHAQSTLVEYALAVDVQRYLYMISFAYIHPDALYEG